MPRFFQCNADVMKEPFGADDVDGSMRIVDVTDIGITAAVANRQISGISQEIDRAIIVIEWHRNVTAVDGGFSPGGGVHACPWIAREHERRLGQPQAMHLDARATVAVCEQCSAPIEPADELNPLAEGR
jgi:hypothetical protein